MNPSRPSYSLTARTLKTVGAIVIIASLVDYLVLPIPFQPLDLPWRVQIATQIVDRGIIPMMGLGFLFAGYWVASTTTSAAPPQNKLLDMRFWALVLSSLLGLLFLILAPLHIRDINVNQTQQLAQVNQQAQQAETKIENVFSSEEFQKQLSSEEFQKEIDLWKEQILATFKNEELFNEQLKNVPEEQKKVLQDLKENPEKVDEFLKQQVENLPDQRLTAIRSQKQTAEQQIRLTAWKSGLRIGVSSLLLAIGYIIIGWTGLKGMMGGVRAKSKPSMG